jgi:transposase-like protein
VQSGALTDPTAAFLHRLTEIHELDDAEFLADGMGYLTAFARHNLSGHLDYNNRNYIEKWPQTVTMRIGRFHLMWMGSSASSSALAEPVQISLQPTAIQSSSRRTNSC